MSVMVRVHLHLGGCFPVYQIVLFAFQPEVLSLKDFFGWLEFCWCCLIFSSFPHEAISVHFEKIVSCFKKSSLCHYWPFFISVRGTDEMMSHEGAGGLDRRGGERVCASHIQGHGPICSRSACKNISDVCLQLSPWCVTFPPPFPLTVAHGLKSSGCPFFSLPDCWGWKKSFRKVLR